MANTSGDGAITYEIEFIKRGKAAAELNMPAGKELVREGNTQTGDLCWHAVNGVWEPVELIGQWVGNYYGVIRDVQSKSS